MRAWLVLDWSGMVTLSAFSLPRMANRAPGGRLSSALRTAFEVAAALACLHTNGIVHGNVHGGK